MESFDQYQNATLSFKRVPGNLSQKQPSGGVVRKRCSENMQQTYRTIPMPEFQKNTSFRKSPLLRKPLKGCFCSIKQLFFNQQGLICKLHCKKMKFSIKEFFSKCDQICSFLRILSHLLKNSSMENFIFCAVLAQRIRSS